MNDRAIEVLVLSRGDRAALERCLAGMEASGASCRPRVVEVGGPAGALREALERLRSAGDVERFAFIDESVRLEPGYFLALGRFLDENPRAAAVEGLVCLPDGGPAPAPAWLPWPEGPGEDPAAPVQEVAGLSGQATLLRASILDELGDRLLDPLLGLDAAQVDLFARCIRRGWQLFRLSGIRASWQPPGQPPGASFSDEEGWKDELLLACRHLGAEELTARVLGWVRRSAPGLLGDAAAARAAREALTWTVLHAPLLWEQRRLASGVPYREALRAIEDRAGYALHERPEVAALVPASARSIVDVGCGVGALGAALRRDRPGIAVRGVELDARWAARAGRVLDAAVQGRAEDGLPPGWPRPDCVILADVLEHLADPWAALRRWREALEPGGTVVVSLPNVLHRSVLSGLLRARWEYRDSGILDRTHLRFFTRPSAVELIEQSGLAVRRLERCMDGDPLGRAGRWLVGRRRELERRGEQLRSVDPLALLLDLNSVQLLLVGGR